MHLDQFITLHLGNRYQFISVFIVFAIGIMSGLNIMDTVFLTASQEFWCDPLAVAPSDEEFTGSEAWTAFTAASPATKRSLTSPAGEPCSIYVRDYPSWLEQTLVNGSFPEMTDKRGRGMEAIGTRWNGTGGNDMVGNSTEPTEKCRRWQFDMSVYKATIISKWSMVCDRSWLVGLSNSVYQLGQLFSILIGGVLADRFGRRPVTMASFFLAVISRFTMCFSPVLELYLISRMLSGAANIIYYSSAFVQVTEILTAKSRALVAVVMGMGFSVGYMLTAPMAWHITDWMYFSLVITITGSVICIPTLFLKESPRWLYTRGRDEEARAILRMIARFNGQHLDEDLLASVHMKDADIEKPRLCESITSRLVLLRGAMAMYLWWTVSLVFYGLSLGVGSLAGNIYINTVILGAVEIPAHLCTQAVTSSHLGRRFSLLLTYTTCAITLLINVALQGIPRTILAFIGKFAAALTFNIVYFYTAELFPTGMRSSILCGASMMARIASTIAPFISQLSSISPKIPAIIFGISSVLASIATLALPETRQHPLPSSVDDMSVMNSLICPCIEKKVKNAASRGAKELMLLPKVA